MPRSLCGSTSPKPQRPTLPNAPPTAITSTMSHRSRRTPPRPACRFAAEPLRPVKETSGSTGRSTKLDPPSGRTTRCGGLPGSADPWTSRTQPPTHQGRDCWRRRRGCRRAPPPSRALMLAKGRLRPIREPYLGRRTPLLIRRSDPLIGEWHPSPAAFQEPACCLQPSWVSQSVVITSKSAPLAFARCTFCCRWPAINSTAPRGPSYPTPSAEASRQPRSRHCAASIRFARTMIPS